MRARWGAVSRDVLLDPVVAGGLTGAVLAISGWPLLGYSASMAAVVLFILRTFCRQFWRTWRGG